MSGLFKKYQIMCTNPPNSLEIFEVGYWALVLSEVEVWGMGHGGEVRS